jgi:hypothetical protein
MPQGECVPSSFIDRLTIAYDRGSSPEILHVLSKDEFNYVREVTVSNPSASLATLIEALGDREPTIVFYASLGICSKLRDNPEFIRIMGELRYDEFSISIKNDPLLALSLKAKLIEAGLYPAKTFH